MLCNSNIKFEEVRENGSSISRGLLKPLLVVARSSYGGFFVFLVVLRLIVVKAIVRIAVRIRQGVRGVAVASACIEIE